MSDSFAPVSTAAPATRALGVVFLILLLDVVGITILLPVAPYLVRRYSPDALMVTLLAVIYTGAQFVAAPLLGRLGDRFGRRPVLLASVLGSAVGYAVFGVGGALWVLFLSRLIDGITGGNQSTASAYIADISTPEERAKNFTLIGTAWGLGLVLGPAAGAVLGQLDLTAPAFAAAALALACALLAFVCLPESLPPAQREHAPIRLGDLSPFGAIARMARVPALGRQLLALCLFGLAFNAMNSTEGLFVIDRFAAQPWQLGVLLVVVGAAVAGGQALLVPRLVPRYGERRVAVTCLLAHAGAALATSLAPALWLVYPVVALRHGAGGFIFSTVGALNANRVSPREVGVLMGVTTALNSLVAALGPLYAGAAYDALAPVAPYWTGAAVVVAAALLLAREDR